MIIRTNRVRYSETAKHRIQAFSCSRFLSAWFELRGNDGSLCTARMPRLGSRETTLDVRRIDGKSYTKRQEEERERPERQNFVWRLTTQVM